MCACLEGESRRHLSALFYEHVTDVTTRRRFRDSWGLCNWHTWMIVDTRPSATGVAILYEDLLRVCHERLAAARERGSRDEPARDARPRGLLARVGSSLTRLVSRLRATGRGAASPRVECPLCAQLRLSEAHGLETVLQFAEDPEFARAYERSSGLCIPHLLGVMDRGADSPGLAPIVRQTLAKWQTLRSDLANFVAKHEYRSASPISAEEIRACERALHILAGARNLFGNDMRR